MISNCALIAKPASLLANRLVTAHDHSSCFPDIRKVQTNHRKQHDSNPPPPCRPSGARCGTSAMSGPRCAYTPLPNVVPGGPIGALRFTDWW